MIEIDIPGFGPLKLENLVLDYNGTLAVDGVLIGGVGERLSVLSKKLTVYVITADTFGNAREGLKGIPLRTGHPSGRLTGCGEKPTS